MSSPGAESTVSPDDASVFGGAPSYTDACPLRWHPHGTLPDAAGAERTLAAIAVLEESRSVSNDDNDPLLTEMQYLDAKLNLLMDMVYCLSQQQGERRSDSEFTMSAEALRYSGQGEPPESGQQGVIELALHAFVARALRLPASVLKVVRDDERWTAWLRFDIESESLANALERHVFRRHRRAVADARQARGTTKD